jgi:hypothetical protein
MAEENHDNISNLYISPIAKKDGKKHNSNRDYKLQMKNMEKGLSLYWDGPDPQKFKTKINVGDYFIFWHHKNCVKIHKILNVFDPLCRLSSWTDNVGHSDRKVIELSSQFETILWDDYIDNFDGHKRCMGTKKVSEKKSKKIIDFLTQEY